MIEEVRKELEKYYTKIIGIVTLILLIIVGIMVYINYYLII